MVEATFDKSEKNQGLYTFLKEIAGYFDITEMERIKKALSSQTPQLDMSEEGKGKSLKLDIFYSQKSGKGFVRLYEYVPYTYEPLTDNKEFRIGQIEQLIK